jgi:hypothetical protein
MNNSEDEATRRLSCSSSNQASSTSPPSPLSSPSADDSSSKSSASTAAMIQSREAPSSSLPLSNTTQHPSAPLSLPPSSFLSLIQNNLSDLQKNLFCGGMAGSVGKTSMAPLNRITILLQTSDPTTRNLTMFQTAIGIWREEGIKAYWKGNLTSIFHRFPYSAINFSAYEVLRDGICGKGSISLSLSSSLLTFLCLLARA